MVKWKMRVYERSARREAVTDKSKRSAFGLTELQARIISLRDERGLTFREIGDRLGKNQGNIHRTYQRGKNNQKKLARTGDGDQVPMSPQIEAQLAAFRAQRNGQPVTDKSLLEDIDAVLVKALFLLRNNEAALAETRTKDLTGIASTLIDKRQLLKGEPTAITKLQDVRKLDEVAKQLHEEMQRRGLIPDKIIDVTPEDESG